MNLSEIKDKPISELVDIASELGLEDLGRLKKQEIIFRIFKHKASEGTDIFGGGVLEILNERVETLDECVFVISHRKESIKSASGNIIFLEKHNGITKRVNFVD